MPFSSSSALRSLSTSLPVSEGTHSNTSPGSAPWGNAASLAAREEAVAGAAEKSSAVRLCCFRCCCCRGRGGERPPSDSESEEEEEEETSVLLFFFSTSLSFSFSSLLLCCCCSCCFVGLGLELAGRSDASATLRRADHHASWADSGSERIGVGPSADEEEVEGEGEGDGGGRASGGDGGDGGGAISSSIEAVDFSASTTAVVIPLLATLASRSMDDSGMARARREVEGGEESGWKDRRSRRRRCR